MNTDDPVPIVTVHLARLIRQWLTDGGVKLSSNLVLTIENDVLTALNGLAKGFNKDLRDKCLAEL